MKYFMVKEIEYEESGERLFQYEGDIKKDDVVVIPNYEDNPVTATVVRLVDSFMALTSHTRVQSIIAKVDMKAYKEKRDNEIKRALVLNKMQDKMSEVQLVEKLKKYAEKDDEMRELFKEYQSLNDVIE